MQQVSVLERSERLARTAGRAYGRVLSEMVALAASEPPQAELLRRAEATLAKALRRARAEIRDGLGRTVRWAHRRSTAILLDTIPMGWFRSLEPIRLAELPEADGDGLDLDDLLGPIRRRELSREEALARIRELLFPPPSAEDTERWLVQAAGEGRNWEERLGYWDQETRDKMLSQLVQSVSEGESLTDLRKRLESIVGGVRYKAQRIARTEGRRVADRAQLAAAEQLGDMLAGMQWSAVLDQWTRPDHAARNGKVYSRQKDGSYVADDGEVMPDVPLGPNCRCMTSAVMHPPEEFASDPALRAKFRDAEAHLIPDPSAYTRWFDQASEAQRKTAVGTRRYSAAAARADGAAPEWIDMIDEDGKLLSPAEIRRETPAERAERRRRAEELLSRWEAAFRAVHARGGTI